MKEYHSLMVARDRTQKGHPLPSLEAPPTSLTRGIKKPLSEVARPDERIPKKALFSSATLNPCKY